MRVLLSKLGRSLLLFPNTLSCFIHCDGSGFLVFVVRVRSRWHKSSYGKIVQRLRPNPHQLVSSNGKADSKERSHRESCDSKSDNICNFHDLSSEARCPHIAMTLLFGTENLYEPKERLLITQKRDIGRWLACGWKILSCLAPPDTNRMPLDQSRNAVSRLAIPDW